MPEPASVGAAETVMPVPIFAVSAGPPRPKAPGAAPSAEIVTWSVPVFGAGTVTPFEAVTVTAPGEPNGVPGTSNEYVEQWYGFDGSLFALVPKIAGKPTDAMPDCASLAVAPRVKSPAWSAFSHRILPAPS